MNLVVNCLWLEGSYQQEIYTPRQLSSSTWVGAITASLYHNLYFSLFSGTTGEMVTAAISTSNQLHELAPALLSPTKEAVYHNGKWKAADIAVSVHAVPVPGLPVPFFNGHPVLGSASITGAGAVVAHAWSETPATGAAETYCVFLVVVHTGSQWTQAHGSGAVLGPQLSNYTLTNIEWAASGMPRTHGTYQFTASMPFEPAPGRAVPILGSGDTRVISDCHFTKTSTEYDRKPGIKRLSCTKK